MTWINMRPYDVNVADIIERAVAAAQDSLPGWIPREGLLEIAIIEAMALEVEEAVFATHRLTAAILRGVLRLLGVQISDGVPPTATARFTAFDTAGHTIPAGSVLRLTSDGQVPVQVLFRTTTECVIDTGDTETTVAIVGLANTAAVNGTAIAEPLELIDTQDFVQAVTVASIVTDGENAETEDDYIQRGIDTLARLTDTLVIAPSFEFFALAWPGVARAHVENATEAPGDEGDALGHITTFVLAAGGVEVSTELAEELAAAMQARSSADLLVHVSDIEVVTVDVTASVRRYPGFSAAQVAASCRTALAAYLDPDMWPVGQDVEINELVEVLGRDTTGVDLVTTPTLPADTVAIGPRALAKLGTATITVTDP